MLTNAIINAMIIIKEAKYRAVVLLSVLVAVQNSVVRKRMHAMWVPLGRRGPDVIGKRSGHICI